MHKKCQAFLSHNGDSTLLRSLTWVTMMLDYQLIRVRKLLNIKSFSAPCNASSLFSYPPSSRIDLARAMITSGSTSGERRRKRIATSKVARGIAMITSGKEGRTDEKGEKERREKREKVWYGNFSKMQMIISDTLAMK